MKKYFFFKEYLLHSTPNVLAISSVQTQEVNFDAIEKELPVGAKIKYESVKTIITGEKFIVYGEYLPLATELKENVATEAISIDEVLGDQETLPSVN